MLPGHSFLLCLQVPAVSVDGSSEYLTLSPPVPGVLACAFPGLVFKDMHYNVPSSKSLLRLYGVLPILLQPKFQPTFRLPGLTAPLVGQSFKQLLDCLGEPAVGKVYYDFVA